MSALQGVMASPALSVNDSTVMGGGRTLPDVSLGSLGSSFRSEDQEPVRRYARTPSSKAPNLPTIISPETSLSASVATPSPDHPPPATALLSLSPPPSVRRSSSHSDLPDPLPGGPARRRPKVLRRRSAASSASSDNEGMEGSYGQTEDEVDPMSVLSALSLNVSPGKKKASNGDSKSASGPSRKGGRHSVGGDVSGPGPLTLRDQEQQLSAARKDIFNLQLEVHFLRDQLTKMAPDHIEAAIKENVKLKVEIMNMSKEMKLQKKLLLQQDKDLQEALREREGAGRGSKQHQAEMKELEGMYEREKERRIAAEDELRAGGAMAESEGRLRDQMDRLQDEVDGLRGTVDDQNEEMDRLKDVADRAQDELDTLKTGLGDSVGLGKGREARMLARLEDETGQLQAEIEHLRRGGSGDPEDVEDRINHLRDQLAASQLDLDRRELEIEQLNEELDAKVKDHEKEIQEVTAEWRNEALEARAQVDELRDLLVEREEDLNAAVERIEAMEAAEAETHDRLEDTMKNIEQDNVDKDADLVSANREIEELGKQVYDLEDAIEAFRVQEDNLKAELQSADQAFEDSKAQYENLVSALKEARKKSQDERDKALGEARSIEEKMYAERERARRERREEVDGLRRRLEESEEVRGKIQSELESARDRVARRDRELTSAQTALRDLETEKDRLGPDGRDSARLGNDIARSRRDLAAKEEELARALKELEDAEEKLRQRDIERGQMLDKQRDLENRLSSERQGRLNLSDKLDLATKNARQHERDAEALRERLEEIEPLVTETQQQRLKLEKQSDQDRQEKSDLLLRVFREVNKYLGATDQPTPANFSVFRDTLLTKLRSMNTSKGDYEKKIKDAETSMDQRLSSLKRQVEQKGRSVDGFEAAVKKLETTKSQWRLKYATKEGELDAARARNAQLERDVAALRSSTASSSTSPPPASTVRSLTERATAAERRVSNLMAQLSQLEAKLAEYQAQSGQAQDNWAARVREYEHRLKVAGEKIKTEKQGGRERARGLEDQVESLTRQVEDAKRRNTRAEGVVASAAHLL